LKNASNLIFSVTVRYEWLSFCGQYVSLPTAAGGKDFYCWKLADYRAFSVPDNDDFRELDVKFIVFPEIGTWNHRTDGNL
jgi:hypothetical protein